MAVEGLAGANLLIGVLNLVPGLPLDGGRVLKAAVWGLTGDVTPGRSPPAGAVGSPPSLALCWPLCQERSSTRRARRSSTSSCRSWSRCSCGPGRRRRSQLGPAPAPAAGDWWPATSPAARSPSRTTCRSPRRPPGAGGRGRRHRDGHQRRAARSASSTRRPCWRRPRTGGRGSPVSTVARTLDDGSPAAGRDHRVRTWSARSRRRPRSEYLLVEDDGSIYGVLATADVDRAFREA